MDLLRSEIDGINKANREAIESLKNEHQMEINDLRQSHKQEIDILDGQNTSAVEDIKRQHELELNSLRAAHKSELSGMSKSDDLTQLKQQHQQEMARLKQEHQVELTKIKQSVKMVVQNPPRSRSVRSKKSFRCTDFSKSIKSKAKMLGISLTTPSGRCKTAKYVNCMIKKRTKMYKKYTQMAKERGIRVTVKSTGKKKTLKRLIADLH